MIFIRLQTAEGIIDLRPKHIESLGLDGEGTIICATSGRIYLANHTPEWIRAEINAAYDKAFGEGDLEADDLIEDEDEDDLVGSTLGGDFPVGSLSALAADIDRNAFSWDY